MKDWKNNAKDRIMELRSEIRASRFTLDALNRRVNITRRAIEDARDEIATLKAALHDAAEKTAPKSAKAYGRGNAVFVKPAEDDEKKTKPAPRKRTAKPKTEQKSAVGKKAETIGGIDADIVSEAMDKAAEETKKIELKDDDNAE